MRAGATDSAYERAFSEQVLPALNQFKPQAILISAGFDAHRDDPLADVQLSTDCYGWMTARVMEVAEQHSGGRVLSLLEGGYHLQRTAECISRHLAVMSGYRAD
jgi:acetoin utilization deacetylase AcuC-like enzyme